MTPLLETGCQIDNLDKLLGQDGKWQARTKERKAKDAPRLTYNVTREVRL